MSQVFLALLSLSEPNFEYSITGEQLLIYVLHDESVVTPLRMKIKQNKNNRAEILQPFIEKC
jgi:hypothetical protein